MSMKVGVADFMGLCPVQYKQISIAWLAQNRSAGTCEMDDICGHSRLTRNSLGSENANLGASELRLTPVQDKEIDEHNEIGGAPRVSPCRRCSPQMQ